MLPELPGKRIIRRVPVVQMRHVQLPMRLQVPDLLHKERPQELLPLQIIAATCSHKLRQNALPGLLFLPLIADLPEQPLQIELLLVELPQPIVQVPVRSRLPDSLGFIPSLLVRRQPAQVQSATVRGHRHRLLPRQEETIQVLPPVRHRERVRLAERLRRLELAARLEQVVLLGQVRHRAVHQDLPVLHGHPALVDRKINN